MDAKEIPDVQLKELIDTLHRDGVSKGRQESETLINQAQLKADEILSSAKSQADTLLSNAKREQERLEQAGRESLQQASRDLVLQVKKRLESLFTALLRDQALTALKEESIAPAIATMISQWSPERQGKSEVVLPQAQTEKLAQTLRKALAEKMKAGLEVKTSSELTSGFRIAEKDGHAYFDFSAESVSEALSIYLNPVMSGIVKEALRKDV